MEPVVPHRFPISNVSEEPRFRLGFEHLPYEVREHHFGLPQLHPVRLSKS